MQARTIFVAALAALLVSSPLLAQGRMGRRPGGGRAAVQNRDDDAGKKNGVKPYDEVITDEATTDTGLFMVHRVDEKILYEITPAVFDREMLWVTQIARTQAGFGYGGTSVGNRVVVWELRGEKVLLRDVKFQIRTPDQDDSLRHAVEASDVRPIIQAFPIKAWGKDKAAVIDVTDLFTGDLTEFSPARRLGASGVDGSRTFVEEVKAFPENIETKVLKTYRLSAQRGDEQTPRRRRGGGERRDPTQSAVTVLMHYSMVLLPAEPMQPRLFDDRVGYFTVRFQEFDTDEHEVENTRYITRWRMEKEDPDAEVSDPVKPIIFHVGRGVPDKWRPYVRKGIEMWQPAFEAAGFSNAIIARDAPSRREDPDWDAEDARISSIRWLPSTTENAMGPHVHDPRSGEILESDIIVYHNILKLCRDWYFVQASPSDEAAQRLPLADETLGECLAYVIAHEVGHTLGFPHNMKASSSYTVAQLRDPEFTRKHGTEASIMDYGRFNYVAQPGDGAALIPVIGPYDFFALEWGYRQFPEAGTPEAERADLKAIVDRQREDGMLLFGDPDRIDPSQQSEDLSGQPILATELGLKNLDRVLGYLVDATCSEGENYDLLRNMYDEVIGQRDRELGHVVSVVGGVRGENFWFGDAERVYHPIDADTQRRAVALINASVFETPASLIEPGILRRLEPSGAIDRIGASQKRILRSLLSEGRILRMSELAEENADDAYLPLELLDSVRTGIWNELEAYPVAIDVYRRNLQRAHVEVLSAAVRQADPASDLPALARQQLETIKTAIVAARREKDMDQTTDAHLVDLGVRITQTLEGREPRPAVEAAASGRPGR